MRLFTILALCTLVLAVGCAQPDTNHVPGSFIVTTEGLGKDTDKARSILFAAYGDLGLKSVEAISKDTFAINIEKSPGLESLQRIADKIGAIQSIQANVRYQIPPQPRPQFKLRAPN